MSEKPKGWTPRVIGGTDVESRSQTFEVIHSIEVPEGDNTTPFELLQKWAEVVSSKPADAGKTKETYITGAEIVIGWTYQELFYYLQRNDVWVRPSFTFAVLDEVLARKELQNFQPRI